MKAVLVRIGVDHSYGCWNAPVDPESGRFVFVPIPEKDTNLEFHNDYGRYFHEVIPALERFVSQFGRDLDEDLQFPRERLLHGPMHLDPDFEYLTYGNRANRKGSVLRSLSENDLVVFYAGMRSLRSESDSLVYGIVGLLVVDTIQDVDQIPEVRWQENAHTRKIKRGPDDIVIWGKPQVSGRLSRMIPIGEYRNRAYRVRRDLLKAWGDLSVKDGFIQRSAVPPKFCDAERFYRWFQKQGATLLQANFDSPTHKRVVIVHLRQPRCDANERRDDPFYEFGSFGCTGCHGRNLMNRERIDELAGVRLAFAQGGPLGFRLILLTPPVDVCKHKDVCELKWDRRVKPFRYEKAPLLIDNNGETDVPQLSKWVKPNGRPTWMAQFSSHFRTRRRELEPDVAAGLVDAYDRAVRSARRNDFAADYAETMAEAPPAKDTQREQTYNALLRKQGVASPEGGASSSRRCGAGKRSTTCRRRC